jgi:hypothetical protein
MQPETMRVVLSESTAVAVERRAVVTICSKPRILRRLTRIILAMGVDVVACEGPEASTRWMGREEVKLLICEVGDFANIDALIQMMSNAQRVPIILLMDNPNRDNLAALFAAASDHSLAAIVGAFDDSDLLRAIRKILQNDLFGVEKYLNWGSAVHGFKISGTSDKLPLIQKLYTFCEKLQSTPRTTERLLTVADEFIMNSLFDAPVDADGHHVHADDPRESGVALQEDQAITFGFGSDGRKIIISCSDAFGSLDVSKTLKSLARCVRGGEDQISQGPGGAGLGVYLAYQQLDHLVINLHPNKRTEFIGVTDLGRPEVKPGKSFSLFVKHDK